jgi:hypothetical protein
MWAGHGQFVSSSNAPLYICNQSGGTMIAAINLVKDRGAEVEQIRVVSSFLILSDTCNFPKPSSTLLFPCVLSGCHQLRRFHKPTPY